MIIDYFIHYLRKELQYREKCKELYPKSLALALPHKIVLRHISLVDGVDDAFDDGITISSLFYD